MKRRTALVGSLAALTAATSAKAADMPVDLQLVLAVDVSRSIDEVEAELQRRGYIEALTNERVIDAVLSGENKRIALCYTEWAGTHYQMVVIDWTVIDSAGAARRFAEKLAEAPRTSQSWTAVGAAMAHAAQRFEGSGFSSRRRVIDISGDGRTNDGPPAELVRDKLVAQGVVINGLPVMMNRTNFGRPPDLTLDKYYEENVIGGPGSFMIVADNFDHFGRAVRTKLVREVSGVDVMHRPIPAESLEWRGVARELHRHAEMAERISEDVGLGQLPSPRDGQAVPIGHPAVGLAEDRHDMRGRHCRCLGRIDQARKISQHLARPAGLRQNPIKAERLGKFAVERHIRDAARMADQHDRVRPCICRPQTAATGDLLGDERRHRNTSNGDPVVELTAAPGDEQR